MNHTARRTLGLVCLLLLCCRAAPCGAAARDLLAHASDSQFWVAHVGQAKDGTTDYLQTEFMARALGGGDAWAPLPPVASRVTSLASSGNELAASLLSGEWVLVSDSGNRLGPSLPMRAKMLALASDGEDLWAIGEVNLADQTPPPPTAPTTQPAVEASTQPSTAPASPQASTQASGTAAATTQAALPATGPTLKSAAYHFKGGSWEASADLPDAVPDAASKLSLAVVNNRPVLAYVQPDGAIRVLALTPDHGWQPLSTVRPATQPSDFKVVAPQRSPVLWEVGPSGAGTLFAGPALDHRVDLRLSGPHTGDIAKADAVTIATTAERYRLLFSAGGKVYEQAYDLQGQPAGDLAPLAEPQPAAIPLPPFIVAGIAMILIATGAAFVQRRTNGAARPDEAATPVADSPPREVKLQLAPFGVRFAAGMIDMIPILIASALIAREAAANVTLTTDTNAVRNPLIISTLAYLLHTTVAELIAGATIGKMLFGLKVVSLDGQPPRPLAIVIRNLLRIIDVELVLPLALVLFTPLRQRIGDMAARTVVISKDPPVERDED